MLKPLTQEEDPRLLDIKRLFSIVGNKEVPGFGDQLLKRNRPLICPVCREVFYAYGDARAQYTTPMSQEMNSPDSSGIIRPRSTCGSVGCYDAEWTYCFRTSPWFLQRQERMKENDTSKNNRALSEQRRELFGEKQ